MQKQANTSLTDVPRTRPPWSPVVVLIMGFLLPPGGAVLAVRSMGRMRNSDPDRTLRETIATVAVFTVGLAVIFTIATVRGGSVDNINPGVLPMVEIGTSLACYFMLRPPYIAWRRRNPNAPSASWLSAAGTTLLYGLLTSLTTALLRTLFVLIAAAFGISGVTL